MLSAARFDFVGTQTATQTHAPLLWPRCYAAMETAAKQAGGGSHREAPGQITGLI